MHWQNITSHHIRAVLTALMLAAGCGGCGGSGGGEQGDGAAVPVTVAPVTVEDVTHDLIQVGTLRGNEEVVVKAEIRGVVSDILFTEGAAVGAGAPLVRLDDAKAAAEARSAEAQLEQHRAELANIDTTLARKQKLLKGDALSRQELDDLLTRQQVTRALIAQSEAHLALARENHADTLIRAPFEGIASARQVAPGDFIEAGAAVVTVVQVAPVKAELRVSEKHRQSIRAGMAVAVAVDAYPDERFAGTVYFISPEVDPATRTFLVKALLSNSDRRLSPGMFCSVSIATAIHRNALIVPWDAVVQLEDRTLVFAVAGDRAWEVPVRIEKLLGDRAEVTGDLTAGQQVIMEGKFTVADGGPVAVTPARPAAPKP